MQAALLLCLCCLATVAMAGKPKNKYENVNLDMILQNQRVLSNYIKCLMDEGPCTSEGRELKRTLPTALASGCEKCDEKQKTGIEKVIKHLISKREKDWDRLVKKYDPKGEYKKKYQIPNAQANVQTKA